MIPCLFLSYVYIPCDIYITYNIYIYIYITYIITNDDVENVCDSISFLSYGYI